MGRARSLAVLATVALAGFITTLDNTVVNVALPSVQRDLGLTVKGLEWVATSYVLSFSTLLLLGGRLADLLGRRAALLLGLAVFTAASGLVGLADTGGALIAARTLQGVGAALVIPAALAVVAGDLPVGRRAFAVGIWTAALAVALAAGPVVGGFVTERWGWHWVFLLNLPFGAVAMLLALAVPAAAERDGPGLRRSVDLPGTILSGVALYFLTYGLVEGGSLGFRTGSVQLCLLTSAVAGLAFLAVEARTARPLVGLGLFRDRAFSGGTAAQVLWGIGVNGVFFFTALYLQRVLGFTPTEAGLAFLPLAGVLLLTTPFVERLSAALGAHRVVAAGLATVAGGLLCVSATGGSATYAELQPGLLLIGAGSALTTPLTVRSLDGVPAARTGMASGVISAAREVSGVFGVVLVGVVLTRHERDALRAGATPDEAFLGGYEEGLRLAAALVLCGAAVTLMTLRRVGRHRRPRFRPAGARPRHGAPPAPAPAFARDDTTTGGVRCAPGTGVEP